MVQSTRWFVGGLLSAVMSSLLFLRMNEVSDRAMGTNLCRSNQSARALIRFDPKDAGLD